MALTRGEYVAACLAAVPSPATVEHRVALQARVLQEWSEATDRGPTDDALDLTEYEPGAVPFNSFGNPPEHVWNYPTLAEGAKAFHDILQAPEYATLVVMLESTASTADQIIAEWNKTAWGYCHPALVVMARANLAALEALIVPGAGVPVPPLVPPPSGRPTADQLVARQLVVLGDSFAPGIVSQDAIVARRNGWAVFYFAGDHFVAIPATHPIPAGTCWLYANKHYASKREG